MTDDIRGKVVDPAAARARDRRGRKVMALIGVLTVACFLALAGFLYARANTLQSEVDDLATRARVAQSGWEIVASQVTSLGATPKAIPPSGPIGPQGPAGTNGRGIIGTSIVNGRLLISYTDGSSVDVGQVQGAAGAKGSDGRGVTGANATSGHLLLSFSDGSTSDAGQVVGPAGATGPAGAAGRGIKSVSTTNGELTVTYDDGTTVDAGPLPAGPPGPAGPQGVQGPPGSPPAGWTWTDELGRTYHCQRDPSSPDTAPTYSCPTASPTTTTAAARTKPSGR